MKFVTAIKLGLENLNNINGRSSRGEYWYFIIFLFIMMLALLFVISFLSIKFLPIFIQNQEILKYLTGFSGILLFLSYSAFYCIATIRRLHDVNKSAWNIIWFFIPICSLLIIYYCLLSGDKHVNKYGPPSKYI